MPVVLEANQTFLNKQEGAKWTSAVDLHSQAIRRATSRTET